MARDQDTANPHVRHTPDMASTTKGGGKTRELLLLVLLLLVLFYALFASPIAPWPLFATGYQASTHGSRSPHPFDERPLPVSYLESPSRDKRLAAALPIALELRQGLADAAQAPAAVDVEVHDGAGDDYQVEYRLDGRLHRLTLSALPERSDANLIALRTLLDGLAPEPSAIAAEAAPGRGQPIPLNSRDMLHALAELDSRLDAAPEADILLQAAELYAWEAFFKTAVTDSGVADLLATRALAAYLASGARDPFVEGLVWLALDLPAPALASLETAPETDRSRLLIAFATRDLNGLKAASEAGGDDVKLANYLLARASRESGMGSEGSALIKRFAGDYVDFTHLAEYAASIRVVGVSNSHVRQYPLDLLELHLDILGELVEPASLLSDPELVATARLGTTRKEALPHWVQLESRLLGQPLRMRQVRHLFDMDLVKRLLALETQDALYYQVTFEAQGLGRPPQASEIAQLVEQAYPDAPLRQTAWLWVRGYDPEVETRIQFFKTLSLDGADRRLLGDFILFLHTSTNAADFPKVLDALDALHTLSDPARGDLLALVSSCRDLHLVNGCARPQLDLAMAAAPFDYEVAREIVGLKLSPSAFGAYAEGIEHLPATLYLKGKLAKEAGDSAVAETELRRAIAANPSDSKPYDLLSTMLIDDGKPQQAIEVMQSYLEHDHTTLTAGRLRISIGDLEMDAGNAETAYPILEQAARDGTGYGLIGFALASERTGRELQAEKYFTTAAKRYPSGRAPAELALFYLRQGNRAAALQVLRTYRRYNAADYFVPWLAKYAHEAGDPSLAVELAQEASPSDWKGIRVRSSLAREFLELDEPAMAAELYGALARDITDPRHTYPHNYAPRYLAASEAAQPGSTAPLLRELLDLYSKTIPTVTEYLGVHLLMNDEPRLAVPVFLERMDLSPYRADISLLMAALAWREGGGVDAEQQRAILARLQDFDDDWLATRVRFLTRQIDAPTLLAAAKGRSRLCEAHYFLGAIAAEQGRRTEAERHLTISLQTRAANYMEYQYAYDLLRKLDDKDAES